ncbi:MAG: protein phosphatase CheZ [Betaproteobacteria bacterium]|nr:protein phosphatase CheZ [Betaproteobacteria bacterium]
MGNDDNNQQQAPAASINDELLSRVGQITRTLHDSLRALGLDKVVQDAARDIPDVRDRLNYVMSMTEQAAQRVLNATDTAIPLQEQIARAATALCADSTNASLKQELTEIAGKADRTKQQLMDIMMAQDFQDLTGQVIRRIIELAHELESQLVQMLVDYAPAEQRKEANAGLLNGPQIHKDREDVVADQEQVDDLLSSLGF